MFGDLAQLPPTLDSPLSTPTAPGHQLYTCLFTTVFKLQLVMSQDNADVELMDILRAARNYTWTRDLTTTLNRRCLTQLDPESKRSFSRATRLVFTRNEVDRFNSQRLIDLDMRICILIADHTPRDGAEPVPEIIQTTDDDLPGVLSLSKGIRVMVRWNFSTALGIVNGSIGIVVGFYQDQPLARVSAVLVQLDHYRGPPVFQQDPRVIPFVRVQTTITLNNRRFTRSQFPIVPASAITIHKSQGLTLDEVVLKIPTREGGYGSRKDLCNASAQILPHVLDLRQKI